MIQALRTARVAKLADAPDLGSGSARNVGSSPTPSTPLALPLASPMDSALAGGSRLYLKRLKLFSGSQGDFFLEASRVDFYSQATARDNNQQYVYNL